MRIKKFVGENMKQVTEQMKLELGAEAIILDTRRLSQGGPPHFKNQKMVEITAAIDEVAPDKQNSYVHPLNRYSHTTDRDLAISYAGHITDDEATAASQISAGRSEPGRNSSPARAASADAESTPGFYRLNNQVAEITEKLREIAERVNVPRMPLLSEPLQRVYLRLIEHDVDDQIALGLVQSAVLKFNDVQLKDRQTLDSFILSSIAGVMKTAAQTSTDTKQPKNVALIGPTGVGKTTTIAKLSSIRKILHNEKVALISADTYRIGAIEQLRTFAAIADIPMEVAYTPSEMKEAVARFQSYDMIFIDTVGRSQRMKADLSELKKILGAAAPEEIHLVVNAVTANRTMNEILDNFSALQPNRLIVSKVDEAATYGMMLNASVLSSLPVSYITTGQAVPDDVKEADSGLMAQMVYHGEFEHA